MKMQTARVEKDISKGDVLDSIDVRKGSPYEQYVQFFVGRSDVASFLTYELYTCLAAPVPGALGLALRKILHKHLFRHVGPGVTLGRNIVLRHPASVSLGARVGIDDNCLVDARGDAETGIEIGDDVLIARDCIIQAKTGPITIGDRVAMGSQCQLSSVSGIHIGADAMIAGQCYIGGGRYHFEDRDRTIKSQGLYSRGPVRIDEDVWLGAGARIMDGVHIGRGAVIGAGAVIQEDVPPYTIVTPYQKLVKLPRGTTSVTA